MNILNKALIISCASIIVNAQEPPRTIGKSWVRVGWDETFSMYSNIDSIGFIPDLQAFSIWIKTFESKDQTIFMWRMAFRNNFTEMGPLDMSEYYGTMNSTGSNIKNITWEHSKIKWVGVPPDSFFSRIAESLRDNIKTTTTP
jgi:hypothetical protein